MTNKKSLIYVSGLILVTVFLVGGYFLFSNPWKFKENRPIKILWLNSYHPYYSWSFEQISGFEGVLESNNIDYDMQVFHMDTKTKISEEEKQAAAEEAIKFIEEFNPDLIYATDDNAQKYVGMHYLNSNIPWVFSGVNAEPEEYNYNEAENVAGLLERELFGEAIQLLRSWDTSIKNFAVIGDNSVTTSLMMKNLKNSADTIDANFIDWYAAAKLDEYKNKILEYNQKADALVLLSITAIKDDNDKIVSAKDTVEWIIKNSNIPEVAIEDDVDYGALLAYSTTGYQMGTEAGYIAIRILIDGVSPQKIGIHVPQKNVRRINVTRADMFNLEIPNEILDNSELIKGL